MTADDGEGHDRSYLASDDNFKYLKDLETRNLVVPVVGDFGGDKAIRGVGAYIKRAGGTVSGFYVSNVEQYLVQDGKWDAFCASVLTAPLDESSIFIRSGPGGPYTVGGANGVQTSSFGNMLKELRCRVSR